MPRREEHDPAASLRWDRRTLEPYNESAIRSRFRHEAFIRHLAIAKRQLYETILRCLDAYHAESSVDARLNRTLHHVE